MMRVPAYSRSRSEHRRRRVGSPELGFTVIELMTVVAIIGILAAVLMPTVASVRVSASRAKTRVQFSQWAGAIEAFRQEYGYYPRFGPTNTVNGGATTAAGERHLFHDTLAGKHRDGAPLPALVEGAAMDPLPPEKQNRRRVQFLSFTEEDLFSATSADAARRNLLHDSFGSTDIAVLVDVNLDGVINDADYPEKPAVSPPDNPAVRLSPGAAEFPAGLGSSGGIRAGVLFYSAPPKAVDASQLILSWK